MLVPGVACTTCASAEADALAGFQIEWTVRATVPSRRYSDRIANDMIKDAVFPDLSGLLPVTTSRNAPTVVSAFASQRAVLC